MKLYYPDTGLLISTLDEESQEDLRVNKNLGVYKGALYENFVAEAFIKLKLGLFYYKKENSTLEEDFFVRSKSELLPVEVKSNNARSKSLSSLIKNENYSDIKNGIKLGDFNVGYVNNIYTFPYFCAFMIKAFVKKWIKYSIIFLRILLGVFDFANKAFLRGHFLYCMFVVENTSHSSEVAKTTIIVSCPRVN